MASSFRFDTNRKAAAFRVGGSAYTAFGWGGRIIGLARGIAEQSPRPVAQPVAIQPMDQRYPMDIITPAALGPGTLTFRTFEKWNSRVWDDMMDAVAPLSGGQRYTDLVSVFIALAALSSPVNAIKVINPPRRAGETVKPYGDLYLNCKITDIRDDEDVEIATMEIVKNITITYTRKVRTDAGLAGFGDLANNAGLGSALPDVITPILGL
jgi:hypothetical protein